MQIKKIIIAAGIAIGAVGLLLLLTQKSYREVTERPTEQAAPAGQPLKETSIIGLTALLPYETLTNALNAAVPKSFVVEGRRQLCGSLSEAAANAVNNTLGGDGGKVIGWIVGVWVKVVTLTAGENKCFDGDYKATITREGPFTTGLNVDAFHISVPVKVDGFVGLAGTGAQAFGVDKKNVRGEVLAYADIRTQIDQNWCPTVQIAPGITWKDPAKVEVMHNWWMDIDSQADEGFKKGIEQAQKQLPTLLTCDLIKDKVKPLWRQYTIDLPKEAGVQGSVVVTPKRVGFSGLTNTPKGMQLSLTMEAESEVMLDKAAPVATERPALIELPMLQPISLGANGFKLSVPLTVSYQSLKELVRHELMKEPFTFKNDFVEGSLTVKDVETFPAGDHLVIGVKFESDLSRPKSLAPRGWVYMKTKLSFDPATQTLRPAELSYSRILDNDLWNSVSYVFKEQINWALTRNLKADLKDKIATVQREQRTSILERLKASGIALELKDEPVKLATIEVLSSGVRLLVKFEGTANVVVLPTAVETAMKELVQTPPPPPPPALAPRQPAEPKPQKFERFFVNPSARTRQLSQ